MKLTFNNANVVSIIEAYLEANTKFVAEDVRVVTTENGIEVYLDEPVEAPVELPDESEEVVDAKPKAKRGRKPKQPVEVVEEEGEEPVVEVVQDLIEEPVVVDVQDLIEEVHQEMIEEASFDEEELVESMVTEAAPSKPLFAEEPLFDISKPLFG